VYKIMMLIRKRADLTREQFIDYYDNRHVPFMHELLPTGAAIHRRNFVLTGGPGEVSSPECDVICEIFYEDLATAQAAMRSLADPRIRRLMEEDEDRFIERGSIRRFVVDAHETVFRPLPGRAG
jgi:uncharacterized protein (TIGR02118 family)